MHQHRDVGGGGGQELTLEESPPSGDGAPVRGAPGELDAWKQIAPYLKKRDVSTVQR